MRELAQIARHAIGDGPAHELLAITSAGPVTIGRGVTRDLIQLHPPSSLALHAPWASGGVVIERGDQATRAVLVRGERCNVMTVVDGTATCIDAESQDAENVTLLWTLQSAGSTRPTLREMYASLLLFAAVRDDDHRARLVGAWAAQEYSPILRAHGLPRGAPTWRRLFAIAHALDLPARHPVPGARESSMIDALTAVVPPRWVLAHELRLLGRPDWAEVVMAARAS